MSSAEVKASKAKAKAKELPLKLAMVINAVGEETPPAAGLIPLQDLEHHPHKKSRGVSSQSVAGAVASSHSYLSLQRKGTTANKRQSFQSPGHFSDHQVESLSSKSSPLGSLSKGILTISNDSKDGDRGTTPLTGFRMTTAQILAEVVGTVLPLGAALVGVGQRSCQLSGTELPTPPPTMTRLTVTMARTVTSPLTGLLVATGQSLTEVFGMVLPLSAALGGAGQRSCRLPGAEFFALPP